MSGRRRTAGYRAQQSGAAWERLLSQSCDLYRAERRAYIRQVGAPFRVTATLGGGRFSGVYEGAGGCDFVGHVNGRPFEADAKRTTGRWSFSDLKPHQAKSLDDVVLAGGYAGILLLLDPMSYWLPWGGEVGIRYRRWRELAALPKPAPAGSASLSVADCIVLGTRFKGGDFLAAVLS